MTPGGVERVVAELEDRVRREATTGPKRAAWDALTDGQRAAALSRVRSLIPGEQHEAARREAFARERCPDEHKARAFAKAQEHADMAKAYEALIRLAGGEP